MLKTYRIIPLVFILFFFSLASSAAVSTDVWIKGMVEDFEACGPLSHLSLDQGRSFRLLKQQKNCYKDVAVFIAEGLGGISTGEQRILDEGFMACKKIRPVNRSGGETVH